MKKSSSSSAERLDSSSAMERSSILALAIPIITLIGLTALVLFLIDNLRA